MEQAKKRICVRHSIRIWSLVFIVCALFFVSAKPGFGADIRYVNATQVNSELYVTTFLQPDQKLIEDLNNGLSKEIVFYIDLFRHWKVWPDEFVLGKKIIRVLKTNPIKREYVGSSTEGNIQTIKRFKDLESMLTWAMNITDLKLVNTRALEPDRYYVKVTAESNLKKLPPVIGYLLFFVPGKEFNVSRDSVKFRIPSGQGAE